MFFKNKKNEIEKLELPYSEEELDSMIKNAFIYRNLYLITLKTLKMAQYQFENILKTCSEEDLQKDYSIPITKQMQSLFETAEMFLNKDKSITVFYMRDFIDHLLRFCIPSHKGKFSYIDGSFIYDYDLMDYIKNLDVNEILNKFTSDIYSYAYTYALSQRNVCLKDPFFMAVKFYDAEDMKKDLENKLQYPAQTADFMMNNRSRGLQDFDKKVYNVKSSYMDLDDEFLALLIGELLNLDLPWLNEDKIISLMKKSLDFMFYERQTAISNLDLKMYESIEKE